MWPPSWTQAISVQWSGKAIIRITSMWKLKINLNTDAKLMAHFPNDPHSDLTLLTHSESLHLSLAYLAIDSAYFASLQPQESPHDLKHLPEEALLSVLKSMYGGPLCASSVSQLEEIMEVIVFLGIEEYRQNIAKGLLLLHNGQPSSPLFGIDMLQLCLSHGLIEEYICQLHFTNKLQSLENSKSYLQLGKLSQTHLNELLLGYRAREGPAANKTINTILENYFNRKSLRPAEQFQDARLMTLKQIWEDFHHKFTTPARKSLLQVTQTTPTAISSETSNSQCFLPMTPKTDLTMKLQKVNTLPPPASKVPNADLQRLSEEELLDLRVKMLERQARQKDEKIKTLQQQLQMLTSQLSRVHDADAEQLEDITLLQNVVLSRKSKESKYCEEEDSISTTSENAFQLGRLKPRPHPSHHSHPSQHPHNSYYKTPHFQSKVQLQ